MSPNKELHSVNSSCGSITWLESGGLGNCLKQCLSGLTVHGSLVQILIKCRFLLTSLGWGLWYLAFVASSQVILILPFWVNTEKNSNLWLSEYFKVIFYSQQFHGSSCSSQYLELSWTLALSHLPHTQSVSKSWWLHFENCWNLSTFHHPCYYSSKATVIPPLDYCGSLPAGLCFSLCCLCLKPTLGPSHSKKPAYLL